MLWIRPSRRMLAAALIVFMTAIACRDITRPVAPITARTSYSTIPAGAVMVSPSAMNGWAFTDDRADTLCTDQQVCTLVDGPSSTPLGTGSAELATPTAQDAKTLRLIDYAGLRFDRITELRYSTFRQTVDAGNNLAIALQVNADFDLTDEPPIWNGQRDTDPRRDSSTG